MDDNTTHKLREPAVEVNTSGMREQQPESKTIVDVQSYRDDEPDEELQDNPMALVFPPPQTDAEIFDLLLLEPQPRAKNFKQLSLAVRLERVDRSDECYWPFPWDIVLLRTVLSLSRKTFRYRHPKNPQVMEFILKLASGVSAVLPRLQRTGGGDALGYLVSGPTGTGKSSLVDRLGKYFGEYGRRHFSVMGRPCVWPQLGLIRINAQPTWKATLSELLKSIDRQLGHDVLFTRERAATEHRLQTVVATSLSRGFAPAIVIDEFQRLSKLRPSTSEGILQKLVDLMQEGGIPIVVIGTEGVRELLTRHSMLMSKFTPGEAFPFHRLREDDPNTGHLISMLKEYSASVGEISYSEDFDKYLVLHSMGVRRIMRHFMRWVCKRHANAEAKGVNIVADRNLLQSIADFEMAEYKAALSALRKFDLGFSLNYDELQAYEDYIPDEPDKEQSTAQKVTEAVWRAESQKSRRQETRVIDVDEFVYLRAQVSLKQYELDAEQGGSESACQVAVSSGDAHVNSSETPAKEEKGKRGRSSSVVQKRVAKAKARVAEISNVIPLSAVRPPQKPPSLGVDPGDLPN